MKSFNALVLPFGLVALTTHAFPAWAQSIVPASDGTGTTVNQVNHQIDINGGSLSGDGATLFHSFQDFGLTAGEIANFNATTNIQNILGRVVGGNPSSINGLIQVSGSNANLFLLNPAGILFGADFSLNLAGSFTATTASGITFDAGFFEAVGSPDYAALVGNPTGLVFADETPGAVVNAGNAAVATGQTLRLVGGQVINTGTLSAPGGDITIAAVPGESLVRISQTNGVLALDLAAVPTAANVTGFAVTDLPTLLTGSPLGDASGVVVNGDGSVSLTGSTVAIPNEPELAIASGVLDASGAVGGAVDVLGETVGLLNARVDVSGETGGGQVRVGGDYLGQGPVPNAEITVVDATSTINADATGNGDGGRVIVWSDLTSRVAGVITARGGWQGGDGGFVETSSAGFLEVDGAPDVSAFVGLGGTWLIDPSNIEIGDFGGTSTGINGALPFTVSAGTAQLDIADLIAALTGGADVTVTTVGSPGTGDGDITLSTDLDFDGTGNGSLTLTADRQVVLNGAIEDSNLSTADSLTLTLNGTFPSGSDVGIAINQPINTQGGDITLNSPAGADINALVDTAGGSFTLLANGLPGIGTRRGQGVALDALLRTGGGAINISGFASNANQSGLVINAPIDPGGGTLTLAGETRVPGLGSGLGLAINVSPILNGGDVTLTGNSDETVGIAIAVPILTNGGNLTLNAPNAGVDINALIDTAGGNFTVAADGSNGSSSQGVGVNAPIRTQGGALTLLGHADSGQPGLRINAPVDPGSGTITLTGRVGWNEAPGVAINVPIELNGEDLVIDGTVTNGDDTGIVVSQPIRTRGGNVTLNGQTGVNVNALIETAGGSFTITPPPTNFGGPGVTINAPIRTNGGAIEISGLARDPSQPSGLVINAPITPAGGTLTLAGESAISLLDAPGLVVNVAPVLNGETVTLTGQSRTDVGILIATPIFTNGSDLTLSAPSAGVDINALIDTAGGDFIVAADGGAFTSSQGVDVNAPIRTQGGALTIIGHADDNQPGLSINAAIDPGGGPIALTGRVSFREAPAVVITVPIELNGEDLVINGDVFGGDDTGIVVDQPIRTRGGNLTLNGLTGVDVNAVIETAGGDFTIERQSNTSSGQGVVINAPIFTQGGAIAITGLANSLRSNRPGLTINSQLVPGGGTVTLNGEAQGRLVGLLVNTPLVLNGEDLVLNGTASAGQEIGILVAEPIHTNGGTLTLDGHSGVIVNAPLETTGGDFVLQANLQSGGYGRGATLNAPIRTQGGAITVSGYTVEAGDSGVIVNAQLDPGGGAITLTGEGGFYAGPGLLINTPFTLNGEDLTLNGSVNNGLGVLVDQPIRTNGGDLTVNGFTGIDVRALIETAGGDIALNVEGPGGNRSNDVGLTVGALVDAGGGDITVRSIARRVGTIEILGALSTRNGAAIALESYNNLDAGNITNPGGDIEIISQAGAITTGLIDASIAVGNAGNIWVETQVSPASFNQPPTSGPITTGELVASSGNGDGGDITITASGDIADIVTGDITTIASGLNRSAGDITISTPDTISTIGGSLRSQVIAALGSANGGSVSLTAGSDIDTANISIATDGFVNDSGDISLTSSGGNVDTSAGALISAAALGDGGDILLNAVVGDLVVGSVNAQSIAANGGALTFTTGQDITLTTGSIATNNNDIAFNHDVNLAGDATINSFGTGDIVFNTPIDGAFDLALNAGNGEIILNEIVGGTTPLTDFAFQGTLNATLPAGLDINADQITLLGDASIISNNPGNIIIDRPLDGFHNLSLDARNGSTLQLDAPIGSRVPLNSLTALDPIMTNRPNGVSITTVNGITTPAITATGGITLLSANGPITTGDLNTSANGNGGDVTLSTNGTASVTTINAQSTNGIGGDVAVVANSFFRATNSFVDQTGQTASISVAGGSNGGTVSINHGGNGTTEFVVGDPSLNGTLGTISRGGALIQNIAPTQGFLNTYSQDANRLQIISVPAPPIVVTPPPTTGGGGNSGNTPQVDLALLIGDLLDATTQIDHDTNTDDYAFDWTLPDGEDISLDVDGDVPFINLLNDAADPISLVDELLEEDIEERFGREFSDADVNAQSIRQSLAIIEAETGTRSVILYAVSMPESMELLLVTPEGNVIRHSVEEDVATRQQTLDAFFQGITTPFDHSYLGPAQQLYDWMIAPFEAELDALEIDTLIFAMDAGLRSLPVAALHDGEQFLVQRYSLGLIPSFSLTDTRYQALADSEVLAMGISDFTDVGLRPLPAVPKELEAIQSFWPGQAVLNAEATLPNLRSLRYQQEFEIIHLASHAEFLPGDTQNSYVQLWDTRLDMDGLRDLRWGDYPQVEFLILSACQTALGNIEAELGFAGLAVNSGVKSALASLWNVDDLATQVLMHELYDHLRHAPIKAQALQSAQLAFLDGTLSARGLETFQRGIAVEGLPVEADNSNRPEQASDLSHPYYWAAFTMIGSPW